LRPEKLLALIFPTILERVQLLAEKHFLYEMGLSDAQRSAPPSFLALSSSDAETQIA
jgi:hypothetical protein